MRKRFADKAACGENILEVEQKMMSVQTEDFTGDIYLCYYKKCQGPTAFGNGLIVQDNNYKWLEFYDYKAKSMLTVMYDANNEIIEWYFDIARRIGKENNMPYEDDLYLDVLVKADGEILMLDEDELKEAYERKEITSDEYEGAYQTANELIEKIRGNVDKLKQFTDLYLYEMLKYIKNRSDEEIGIDRGDL